MAPLETVFNEFDVVWVRISESWADAALADVVSPGAASSAKAVRISIDGQEQEVPKDKVELACVGQDFAEDIAELSNLNEPSLLELVHKRYSSGNPASIYTRAGPVLVAVNPFTDVSELYAAEVRDRHRQAARRGTVLPPHVYESAASAYRSVCLGKAQSIIINGESGAGKTETTKILLTYLTSAAANEPSSRRKTSVSASSLISQVIASSPALECFGNAKTLRNDNSSRFGKFIKLHFTNDGELTHASIEHYLLEKSRVTSQEQGEQGYHAFYYLLAAAAARSGGATLAPLWDKLQLGPATEFKALQKSDIRPTEFVAGFDEAQVAMTTLLGGDDTSRRDGFWLSTGGLLHFGRISFKQQSVDDEAAEIDSQSNSSLMHAAQLWGVSVAAMSTALCTRKIKAGTEMCEIPKTATQAAGSRDALAKAYYDRLFDQLLREINRSLRPEEELASLSKDPQGRERFIGLLDIFGSEVFDINGFEQLLINYANDKLQYFFTQTAIGVIAKLYESEGIKLDISAQDRLLPTLSMLEGSPASKICLLSLLNDESYAQSTDETFVEKLHGELKKLSERGLLGGFVSRDEGRKTGQFKSASFAVRHFGATVAYTVGGFLEKNYDLLEDDLVVLMQSSESIFCNRLFADAGSKKRTIGAKFRDDMQKLVATLNASEGHFIRCIKPNDIRRAFFMEKSTTLDQLKCCGVLEAARVSQAEYPTRMLFREFHDRYTFAPYRPGIKKRRSFDKQNSPAASRMADLKARVGDIATQIFKLDESVMALGRTRIFLKRNILTECERRHARMLELRRVLERHYKRMLVFGHWWRALEVLQDDAKRVALMEEMRAQEQARLEAAIEAERRREEEVEERINAAAEAAREVALQEHEEALQEERRVADEAIKTIKKEMSQMQVEHQLDLASQLERAAKKAADERATDLARADAARAAAVSEAKAEAHEVMNATVEATRTALQKEATEAAAEQLAAQEAKAGKQRAEAVASAKAQAAEELVAAERAVRAATLAEAGDRAATDLKSAMAAAAEEKKVAIAAVEERAADEKAAALAAVRLEAETQLAQALEATKKMEASVKGDAASQLSAALNAAAQEKSAALAAAESRASDERVAAVAAARQEAAAELTAALESTTAATRAEERDTAAATLATALQQAAQEKTEALALAATKAAEEKGASVAAMREQTLAEASALAASQLSVALKQAQDDKAAAVQCVETKLIEQKDAALAEAAERAAAELAAAQEAARATQQAALAAAAHAAEQDKTAALHESAMAAAKEKEKAAQLALEDKAAAVAAEKEAAQLALTQAKEMARRHLTNELAAAAQAAQTAKEKALEAAQTAADKREAAMLNEAEELHMAELESATIAHEKQIEMMQEKYDELLAERDRQQQELLEEGERLKNEHQRAKAQLQCDVSQVAREARRVRLEKRGLEKDNRTRESERESLMQGLALEFIDSIRIYKDSRSTHRMKLLNKKPDKIKDLGDAFSHKAELLTESAANLRDEGKAAEARPVLLQARVFYKACANLERTFVAHLKAVKSLEDLGNYEQARVEYRELMEHDLIHVKAAVLIANGKKKATAQRRGRFTDQLARSTSIKPGFSGQTSEELEEEEAENSLLKEQLTDKQRQEIEACIERVDKVIAQRYKNAIDEAHAMSTFASNERNSRVSLWSQAKNAITNSTRSLRSLGPYRIAAMDISSVGLINEYGTPTYSVNFNTVALAGLKAFPFLGKVSSLSPWDAILMEADERVRRGIPVGATYLAWAYPLPGVAEIETIDSMLEGASAGLAFVINGGFVYANNNFKPVGVHAVMGTCNENDSMDANTIVFDGPYPLQPSTRRKLEQGSRFLPPTVHAHLKDGVTGYTWFLPSDSLSTAQREGSEISHATGGDATGGFAFVYDDHNHDCFFSVRRDDLSHAPVSVIDEERMTDITERMTSFNADL